MLEYKYMYNNKPWFYALEQGIRDSNLSSCERQIGKNFNINIVNITPMTNYSPLLKNIPFPLLLYSRKIPLMIAFQRFLRNMRQRINFDK